ncbi:unnamed protein product [Cochlearia groenlandica]
MSIQEIDDSPTPPSPPPLLGNSERRLKSCDCFGCGLDVDFDSKYCCIGHEDIAHSLYVHDSPYRIAKAFSGNEEKNLILISSLVKTVETDAITGIPMFNDKRVYMRHPVDWVSLNLCLSENEGERSWSFYHCDKNPLFEDFSCSDLSLRWRVRLLSFLRSNASYKVKDIVYD